MQKNAPYKNMPSSDSSNFAAVFEKAPPKARVIWGAIIHNQKHCKNESRQADKRTSASKRAERTS
jgi:hypothetical protein